MSPYPIPSHLDYYGDGVDYFAFLPLEKEALAVCLGEDETPLFYARIDPIRRQLLYANSRREPALLARQNSARIFHLESGGTIKIEPGDVLAAFMGAISEADVIRVIRENPGARAGLLVHRMLGIGRGTAVAVRFIANEEPALAEDSRALDLAVA
jgi:hypothetical protein